MFALGPIDAVDGWKLLPDFSLQDKTVCAALSE
jgi:hypothetical protein